MPIAIERQIDRFKQSLNLLTKTFIFSLGEKSQSGDIWFWIWTEHPHCRQLPLFQLWVPTEGQCNHAKPGTSSLWNIGPFWTLWVFSFLRQVSWGLQFKECKMFWFIYCLLRVISWLHYKYRLPGGWRDGSAYKRPCCSSTGPKFGLQHPLQAAHNYL